MGPLAALNSSFVNIFNFSGRATRSEFWWFFLACAILGVAAFVRDVMMVIQAINNEGEAAAYGISPFGFASLWLGLSTSIPYISLSIRRLHDAGFSGLWWLLGLVPLGGIVLLIMYCLPSEDRHNIYGSAPFGGADVSGRPITPNAKHRAMQGYACLFEVDRAATPEVLEARKLEISEYYRTKVLKSA